MNPLELQCGEVHLKSFVSRKLRREINAAMGMKMVASGDATKQQFKMNEIAIENFDLANDLAVLGMIEKVVRDSIEIPVSQSLIDNMSETDYAILLKKVNEVTSEKIPKE